MSEKQDAFGRALQTYFEGEPVQYIIIEREDGFIEASSGPELYFSDHESWPNNWHEALTYAQGRVLDIGCGAGRPSLYLQSQGLEVMGVDVSPRAIEICRRRGLKQAAVLPASRVSRARLGEFATIIMLGNNFGLMANERRARWMFKRLYRMTSENGRLILESNDIYQTEKREHLEFQARNRERGRMSGQIRLRVRFRTYKDPWMDYLMVSPAEMESLMAGSGWRFERYLPSTEGNTYVVVLVKT